MFPASGVPLLLTKDVWIRWSTRRAITSLKIRSEICYISFLIIKRSSRASYWIPLTPSFLLLIGEFVFMWLMWPMWCQGKFFSSPQTVQCELVLQQLWLFQHWGLPCRLEYIIQLWSAIHLLFQPAAVGFWQYTSILNYNIWCLPMCFILNLQLSSYSKHFHSLFFLSTYCFSLILNLDTLCRFANIA